MSCLDIFLNDISQNILDNANASTDSDASKMLEKDYNLQLVKIINAKDKLTDISLKQIYGYCILGILGFWVIVVAFICIVYIFQDFPNMSDSVLIVLLTTTTTNILVLPTIVLKYLFPNKK